MALNGRLEDLNLLEILQIVAFAKKTGTLTVEGNIARGAVLFQDGVVLCALSSSTTPILSPMAGRTLDQSRAALLGDEIRIALRELVGLREGRFEFVISAEPPTHFEGMDVRKFLLAEGVDPQQLMLELAREIDIERRDSSSRLESSDAPTQDKPTDAEPTDAEPTDVEATSFENSDVIVVLVDDEPQVLDVVREELERAGCTVRTAEGAENALALVDDIMESGRPMVLVTDVAMPSSRGDTFEGGIEVVEHVRESRGKTPTLLMTESLSPEERERAIALGVRKVAFKPALTKLDANEYGADLRSFATVVRRELSALMKDAEHQPRSSAVPDLNHDVMFDFLKTMTDQLTRPANGIARMILRVGSKYCERVALFLVKGHTARGVAALHLGRPAKLVAAEVQDISFDLQAVRAFAEVVYARERLTLDHEKNPLPPSITPGKAHEYMLLPLIQNHEVLSILFCDNPNSGKPLGNLSGLSLFLAQAGMAMENASLHRKLRSFESQFSLDNQGPLTQELTRIVPD